MQAFFTEKAELPYTGGMNTGRPAKRERTAFGERLHLLREAAGLSQQEVAGRLGITQPAYALWERRNASVRIEQLYQLADLFGVSVDELFYPVTNGKARGGPVGRAKRVFEAVSKLPRHRQKQILDVADALLKTQPANV